MGKTHTKKGFLVVGPLRGRGGGVRTPEPLRKNTLISSKEKMDEKRPQWFDHYFFSFFFVSSLS